MEIQHSFPHPNTMPGLMTVTSSSRRWLFLLASLALVADVSSKYLIFHWLHSHPVHYDPATRQGGFELIPGAFRLHTQYTTEPAQGWLRTWNSPEMPHVNQGALFGLGNDRKTSNVLFAIISLLAAVTIIGWSLRQASLTDRWLATALGLILGGTLGNFYDRVVFGGVRDFLYWYKLIDWPVFNIADCCLVVGAAILLVHAFLTSPSTASQQPLPTNASQMPPQPSPAGASTR